MKKRTASYIPIRVWRWRMNREELMDLFSEKIRELLARLPVDYEEVQEIRLRAEKPL